jgi:glycerate kinase
VDARPVAVRTRGTEFLIACDVDNPLVGPKGAAAVYGPQKGATPDDLILLDRALGHYAAVLHRDLGIDVREIPGAGAAGGLGAGLIAFLGARLRPGVEVVMEAVGFRERLERADVVITGEGKLDVQSMHGKTVAGVLAAARDRSRPPRVAALCGRAEVRPDGLEVIALAERFGMDRAMNETRPALADLAAELAGSFSEP